MDPLTALGLASNIVQFVDFTLKLIGSAAEIASSAKGASEQTLKIESAYEKLETFTTCLQNPRLPSHVAGAAGPGGSQTAHVARSSLSEFAGLESYQAQAQTHINAIQELGTECNAMCRKLLQVVSRLRVGKGPRSKAGRLARSFVTAIKTEFAGKKIAELQQQLQHYQTMISLRYLPLLELRQTMMLRVLVRLHQDGAKFGEAYSTRLDALIDSIKSVQVDQQKPGASLAVQPPASLSSFQEAERLEDVLARLSLEEQDIETMAREQILIRSLHFKSLEYRHESILKAHRSTFEWLFPVDIRQNVDSDADIYDNSQKDTNSDEDIERENRDENIDDKNTDDTDTNDGDTDDGDDPLIRPRSKLFNWLQYGSSTFWISGKAGSGKSTLMRFVADDTRTRAALEKWAGTGKTLVIAAHYFWNPGKPMQKTLKGLLQTLLYDILRSCPGLAASIFPKQFGAIRPANVAVDRYWSMDELHNGLRAVSRVMPDTIPTRFCCFVDGLDEFKGDHYELCKLLNELSASENLKFCVSSRPWNVFADAFSRDELTQLCIHDLTRKDIRTYVISRMTEHPLWESTYKDPTQADEFITAVVDRTEGVFLWACLVTQALRNGLVNGDRIKDLRSRLYDLPRDIEPMYSHMLDSVEPFYHQYMARTLLFAMNKHLHIPEWMNQRNEDWTNYYLRELEDDDPNYALSQSPNAEICVSHPTEKSVTTFHRLINARCGGLLVVTSNRVDFIHRTARDFLEAKTRYNDLRNKAGSDYNVHMSLLKVLTYLRRFFPHKLDDMRIEFLSWTSCADYALLENEEDAKGVFQHLQLAGFIPDTPESSELAIDNHAYTGTFPTQISSRSPQPGSMDQRFRLAFLDAGLDNFVEEKLNMDPQYFDNKLTGELALGRVLRSFKWTLNHLAIMDNVVKVCPDVNARFPSQYSTSLSYWHTFVRVCVCGADSSCSYNLEDGSTAFPLNIYIQAMIEDLSKEDFDDGFDVDKRNYFGCCGMLHGRDSIESAISFLATRGFDSLREGPFWDQNEVRAVVLLKSVIMLGGDVGVDMQCLVSPIEKIFSKEHAAPLIAQIKEAQGKIQTSSSVAGESTKRLHDDETGGDGQDQTKRVKVGESSKASEWLRLILLDPA